MLKKTKHKTFANGTVYALTTADGFPIETTDTFLPFYTKDAIGRHQNTICDSNYGDRSERWMIGVSTMSGCPVKCKFCATATLPRWRRLSSDEIVAQVRFILDQNKTMDPCKSKEFKINYTRMGEPFLNLSEVRDAIAKIDKIVPNAHHYVSTIGILNADFSWIKDNVTLQFSIHSCDEEYRNWLIPYRRKMSLENIGKVRTQSQLKTTLNMTLVKKDDFDIDVIKEHFDPKFFFVKLSPINTNATSVSNQLGDGFVPQLNM